MAAKVTMDLVIWKIFSAIRALAIFYELNYEIMCVLRFALPYQALCLGDLGESHFG
jgi:hypothetical protein